MPETSTGGRATAKKKPKPRATEEGVPAPVEEAAAPKPICTVAFCPICMAVTAAQGAAPDALEHLLNAAREFFLAARAVIDVRGDDLDEDPKPARTLQRIDIG